jgi:hypothetical protein
MNPLGTPACASQPVGSRPDSGITPIRARQGSLRRRGDARPTKRAGLLSRHPSPGRRRQPNAMSSASPSGAGVRRARSRSAGPVPLRKSARPQVGVWRRPSSRIAVASRAPARTLGSRPLRARARAGGAPARHAKQKYGSR